MQNPNIIAVFLEDRAFLEICAFKVIHSRSVTEKTQTFKFPYFLNKIKSFAKDNL